MPGLKGKVAVITGGNSGIRYAIAKELKEKGAQVVITGRRKEAVEKAASEINVFGLVADQTNLKDIDGLVSEVARQFGKVVILVISGIAGFKTNPARPN